MSSSPENSEIRKPEATRPKRMDELATLPVFFKLKGRRVLLAGGSEPAIWKAELLSAAGAEVHVYAEHAVHEFAELAAKPPGGPVIHHPREWLSQDFDGAVLALGALASDEDAAAFAAAAVKAGVPFNVIDRPDYCAFQFGAIVNRSPLVVAISTDGGAPVFAQAIRSRLEALLPLGFKRWAAAAKAWRTAGDRLGKTMAERRRFWELFTERAFANPEHLPGDGDLEAMIQEASRASTESAGKGRVALVGAGPGDPELLTLRAVRQLRSADVVLYDDLVSAEVLDFARREAQRILVGKTGYGPACKQTEINALMVRYANEGKRVVRLKSGDPMIFGRGGEEMAELSAAGISYEVIPGISAVQAAAAHLKVSLTHRDHAKRLQLVTGHSRDGKLPANLNWTALADPNATTAVYMALRTLDELSANLIGHGLPPSTPASALFNIGRDSEAIIASTIGALPQNLADGALSGGPTGPCLVIIGEVLEGSVEGSGAVDRNVRAPGSKT